jgi:3-deoxy-7-phosphoheptulonate synthase
MELRNIARANNNRRVVKVKDVCIGDGDFVIIAGPCSVEDLEMLLETSRWVKENGAVLLRGGAFKPRTSPSPFSEAPACRTSPLP